MRSWLLYGRVLLVAAIFPPVRGLGYSVTPNLIALRPSGNDSSAFLRLANQTLQSTAVEITVNEFHRDPEGRAVNRIDADAEFLVYPAQIVMLPGDEVGVQVRWIGEPALVTERAYTLVAREIPLPRKVAEENVEGIKVDITVLLNYEVRIYVTPVGAKPRLVVESVTEMPPAHGNPAGPALIEVVLANQGTAHQSLAGLGVTLTDAARESPTVTFTARDLPALTPPLLAGDRRRLLIPRPAALAVGPVRVSLAE